MRRPPSGQVMATTFPCLAALFPLQPLLVSPPRPLGISSALSPDLSISVNSDTMQTAPLPRLPSSIPVSYRYVRIVPCYIHCIKRYEEDENREGFFSLPWNFPLPRTSILNTALPGLINYTLYDPRVTRGVLDYNVRTKQLDKFSPGQVGI